jgi:ABC-type antimicrobial peptide transport system permease subunit
MKTFRFLTRQLLALITAVISGLLTGQLLRVLPAVLFKQLGSNFIAQYQPWIQGTFWLIPFLISLCVSLLISLAVPRRKTARAAA